MRSLRLASTLISLLWIVEQCGASGRIGPLAPIGRIQNSITPLLLDLRGGSSSSSSGSSSKKKKSGKKAKNKTKKSSAGGTKKKKKKTKENSGDDSVSEGKKVIAEAMEKDSPEALGDAIR